MIWRHRKLGSDIVIVPDTPIPALFDTLVFDLTLGHLKLRHDNNYPDAPGSHMAWSMEPDGVLTGMFRHDRVQRAFAAYCAGRWFLYSGDDPVRDLIAEPLTNEDDNAAVCFRSNSFRLSVGKWDRLGEAALALRG